MRTSTNYGYKLPEGTDNVKRQDLVDNFEGIDQELHAHATSLSDMMYQTAGGTATVITLNIKGTLVTGYPITFIASANNGGAATTINTKKLYKPATTSSPTLIAGKAYTVWYNSTGDSGNGCFFIKASAEGTVTAPYVLAGYTFSNDNDTGLPGGMTNNGAVAVSLNAGQTYTVPLGFHNGYGVVSASSLASQTVASATANQILYGLTAWINGVKVTGTMTNNGTVVITPSTVNQAIAAGCHNGSGYVVGDADLISSNIVSTANIFNIQGTATPVSMGGKYYQEGTVAYNGTITLPFTPSMIAVEHSGGTTAVVIWYRNSLELGGNITSKSGGYAQAPNLAIVVTGNSFKWTGSTNGGYFRAYS